MAGKSYEPVPLEVVEGQRYSWCQCGLSQDMPLCDHSHRGRSEKRSFKFFAEASGTLLLCACAETSTPPLCDGLRCKQLKSEQE